MMAIMSCIQKAIISHQLQFALKPPQNNVFIYTLILWKMVELGAVPQFRVQFFVLLFDIEKLVFFRGNLIFQDLEVHISDIFLVYGIILRLQLLFAIIACLK